MPVRQSRYKSSLRHPFSVDLTSLTSSFVTWRVTQHHRQVSILWDPVSKVPSLVNSNLDALAVIKCLPMMSSQTFSSHTWNLWNSLLFFPIPTLSSSKFPYNFSTERPCFRNVRICQMIIFCNSFILDCTSWGEQGATLRCRAWASYCNGFPCCRA